MHQSKSLSSQFSPSCRCEWFQACHRKIGVFQRLLRFLNLQLVQAAALQISMTGRHIVTSMETAALQVITVKWNSFTAPVLKAQYRTLHKHLRQSCVKSGSKNPKRPNKIQNLTHLQGMQLLGAVLSSASSLRLLSFSWSCSLSDRERCQRCLKKKWTYNKFVSAGSHPVLDGCYWGR